MNCINLLKAEIIFLVSGAILGSVLLFLTPIFQVPDEPLHLVRACEVSQLVLHNDKNEDISKDIFPYKKELLKTAYPNFNEFRNLNYYSDLLEFKTSNYAHNNSGYSFFMYVPSALGLKITSLFTQSPYVLFYMARLFNFLFWLTLTYMAIKISPFKWLFLTVALFPMTVYEGMSISADSVNLAFCFFYISFIFKLIFEEKEITTKKFTALSLLSLLCVFFKGAFFYTFLILLIPSNKFRFKYLKCSVLLIFTLLLQSILYSNSYVFTYNDANPEERFLLLKTRSPEELTLFCNTLLYKSLYWLESAIFRLGWLDIRPNSLSIYLLFFTYLLTSLIDKVKVHNIGKIFVFVLNCIFVLTTILLYFLTFTPLDSSQIVGIQGRYFIPLFLTSAVLIQNKVSLDIEKTKLLKLGILLILVINLVYSIYLACTH